LKFSLDRDDVQEIEIGYEIEEDLKNYKLRHLGHHYSGVLYQNTIISPPRSSSYILVINIEECSCRRIYNKIFDTNRYNSCLKHPNGKIYFTPMKGSRVAEFDPSSENITIFGEPVLANLFCGSIHTNGNIYSYSGSGGIGLYAIDPESKTVNLIHKKTNKGTVIYGSYGSILHYNLKIYSTPGNTPYFYEYDPETNICRTYAKFQDGRFDKAKWAGSCLLENGNIYLVPAFSRFGAEIIFDKKPVITDSMKALLYSTYINSI